MVYEEGESMVFRETACSNFLTTLGAYLILNVGLYKHIDSDSGNTLCKSNYRKQ